MHILILFHVLIMITRIIIQVKKKISLLEAYIYKDLRNLNLDDILAFYNDKIKKGYNLDNINYYKY